MSLIEFTYRNRQINPRLWGTLWGPSGKARRVRIMNSPAYFERRRHDNAAAGGIGGGDSGGVVEGRRLDEDHARFGGEEAADELAHGLLKGGGAGGSGGLDGGSGLIGGV